MDQASFTIIRATNCALAKSFDRDEHGNLQSSAIAHMTEGHATVARASDVAELVALLDLLDSHQAITCGVPVHGDTPLTTRSGAAFRPDAVARTNEAFVFPTGPAFFPIDVDVDGDRFRTVDSVLDALEACSPWLQDVHRVARPSSSSFVDTRSLRGVHVYLMATRGTDIPALAKRMQIEQWAAGMGAIKISKSGALLVRQLADALVYQPSRLMFEAAPVLAGVERNVPADQAAVERAPNIAAGRPGAHRAGNGRLDVQALPRMREIDMRRFETHVRNEKDKRRREAKRIAIDYQTNNAIVSGYDKALGERFGLLATRALGEGKLPACWELATQDYGRITVQQMLDNPDAALGLQVADPFDSWRSDLKPAHFTKAEIVLMGDDMGVWSHKLQTFFKFDKEASTDLSEPVELAAEKLCGLVEYPEPVGKKAAPLVNVKHGLACLLDEIGVKPATDVTTGLISADGLPTKAALLDALSRIGCKSVSIAAIDTALETLAADNTVDPWRDAVLALPRWDGVPRLDNFFPELCGALPSEALLATTQQLFAGVVMRQLQPGSAVPVVPVLIGPGGTGKSYFVQQLAAALDFPQPPAVVFTELIRMTMTAAQSPIAELAEMSGMGKRDQDEVKLWTTDTSDTYRGPWDKRASAHPRRFVLIGTANKHETNRDETGNRRLMPVHVAHPIDPNWVIEAKQVFAEAKERFVDKEGEYERLIRRAAALVKDYNDADMRNGIGTPADDLDELMPPILCALLRGSGDGKVRSADIRTKLDMTPQGRNAHARAYARWMITRGWVAGRSTATRFYTAPQEFIDEYMTNEIDLPQVASPFAAATTTH